MAADWRGTATLDDSFAGGTAVGEYWTILVSRIDVFQRSLDGENGVCIWVLDSWVLVILVVEESGGTVVGIWSFAREEEMGCRRGSDEVVKMSGSLNHETS